MNWKKIRKKQIKIEILYISLILACFAIGIICEYRVMHKTYRLTVDNYDAISLAILQIQATIQTLTIALLALTTSHMTKQYMGINYNDFLFNRKPVIFTQKRIIVVSLISLAVNLFIHMSGFYNLVTAIFLIACLLIIASVHQIYAVFSSSVATEEEIKAYVMYQAQENADLTAKINTMVCFVTGWKKIVETQSNAEYEEYKEIYKILTSALLWEASIDVRNMIQRECITMVSVFCNSSNVAVKERGLNFLSSFYKNICKNIITHKAAAGDRIGGICLLNEKFMEIRSLIRECTPKAIEERFSWTVFINDVVYANCWLSCKEERNAEMSALADLASYMGYYLSENQDRRYDERFWGKILESLEVSLTEYPEECREEADTQVALIKFRYAQSLIRYEMLELLKESMYMRAIRNLYCLKSRYQALLILKIHCYVYYIAEYESTACASKSLKEKCKQFLEDKEIGRIFAYAIDRIAEMDAKHRSKNGLEEGYIFTKELPDKLFEELRFYEIFPEYENGKSLIMEHVVYDFVFFIILYVSNRYYMKELLNRMISDSKVISLCQMYVGKEEVRNRLERFLSLIQVDDPDGKAFTLIADFERHLRCRLKEIRIEEAQRQQREYEENIDEKAVKSDISHKILAYLRNTFDTLISDDAKEGNKYEICVMRFNSLTDVSISSLIDGHYDAIAQSFIGGMCGILWEEQAVNTVDKNIFSEDEDYFAYLQGEDIYNIVGSDFVFRTMQYRNRERLEAYFENKACILEGFTTQGLLLKKDSLKICIQDVKVDICPGKITDPGVEYDQEKGTYSYEVLAGMPVEFTKEELNQYLHDRRKVVDIVVSISMKRNSEKIGDLLYIDP